MNPDSIQLPAPNFLGIGTDIGYERVFEEEFGMKRPAGSNCAATNSCTFAGNDNERSAPNGGLYVFAGSTISKKVNFNAFANQSYGNLDFDFGAGPPLSASEHSGRDRAQCSGRRLCKEPVLPTDPPLPAFAGPSGSRARFVTQHECEVTYHHDAVESHPEFTKQRLRRTDSTSWL